MKYFVLLVLMGFSHQTLAQDNASHKTAPMIITGKVLNSKGGETIKIALIKNEIFSQQGADKYSAITDSAGRFRFNLPPISRAARLVISEDKSRLYLTTYAEPNDSVHIAFTAQLKSRPPVFSGRGASKAQCSFALDTALYRNKERALKIDRFKFMKEDFSAAALERDIDLIDHLAKVQMDILEQYRGRLSASVFKILATDITGLQRERLYTHVAGKFQRTSEKDQILKVYQNRVLNRRDTIAPEIIARSLVYIEHLFEKVRTDLELNGLNKNDAKQVYQRIRETYKGVLFDKVMLWFSMDSRTRPDFRNYEFALKEALPHISDPHAREFLKNHLTKIAANEDVFPFAFPDTTGKIYTPDSFKGKVVLLKFWATGCAGCVQLNRTMKRDVMPWIEGAKDLIVVNVSLDKDSTRWRESVKKGLYTTPGSIDLYTSGQGWKIPMMVHYNILSIPTMLLIDRRGKLLTSSAPREAEKLIREIRRALY